MTFGMSPLETSRSSQGRKVSAATRLLEFGEESTVVEKTADASSMSRECVYAKGSESPCRKALLDFQLAGVVVGVAAVVAIGGDIEEAGIGLE